MQPSQLAGFNTCLSKAMHFILAKYLGDCKLYELQSCFFAGG